MERKSFTSRPDLRPSRKMGDNRNSTSAVLCYNHTLPGWRYRLGVRTEDSQSSNPGSIPGSATKSST